MMLAVGTAAVAAGMGDFHRGATRFAFEKHLLAGVSRQVPWPFGVKQVGR